MRKLAFIVCLTAIVQAFATAPFAQEQDYWIIIEQHDSQGAAVRRAKFFSDDVVKTRAFLLTSGKYEVAAGTFDQFDASSIRQQLVIEGIITSKSYVTRGEHFKDQIWPAIDEGDTDATETRSSASGFGAETSDDSEGHLERQKAIQRVLKYYGDYKAKIDGVFGEGTLAAIAAYQERNGLPATGRLTPEQEQGMFNAFNSELATDGLMVVTEPEAGISIALPIDLIRFSYYDPPFAVYDPVEGESIQVLLISMQGNSGTLKLLHEVLQLSGRLPTGSQSRLDSDSFIISSDVGEIRSLTYAALADGRIKGFSIAWHQLEDAFGREIAPKMLASFHKLDDRTLDESHLLASTDDLSSLISGLTRNEPARTASGFFIDTHGAVATTASAVEGCARVYVSPNQGMQVAKRDPALNLAILHPLDPLEPQEFARFQTNTTRRGSRIAVSGYSFGGDLGAPTLTYGNFVSDTGPDGSPDRGMLRIRTLPGDVGGPILDQAGSVVGMLMPRPLGDRVIPENARVSLNVGAIRDLVANTGTDITYTGASRKLDPVLLEHRASNITVLVQCY